MSALTRLPKLSLGSKAASNMLIRGCNLNALEVIREQYAGSIRCAYIDPPYNNMDNFEYYHDRKAHDVWLESIVSAASTIRELLTQDGSIWISIDDGQMHYLKVAIDRVFGRQNFVTTIVWQQRTTRENRKVFSNNHEYILVYAKDAASFKKTRGTLDRGPETLARFKNPDNDPRGPWQSVSANAQGGHGTASQFYELVAPNGRRHRPPHGRCWVYTKARMQQEIAANNVWFGKNGDGVPRLKKFLSEMRGGLTPHTLWSADEVGTNDFAKKHLVELLPGQPVFDTPKPETLIGRILQIATQPNDLVLDAYLGSGTTAAVAQKMGRRYIGIELGDHIVTQCVERLRKVIAGEQGGISKQTNWQGGGGFEFYELKKKASA